MSLQEAPDLKSLDFQTLAMLAEAVEKYDVFHSKATCRMLMQYVNPCFIVRKIVYWNTAMQSFHSSSPGGSARICRQAWLCKGRGKRCFRFNWLQGNWYGETFITWNISSLGMFASKCSKLVLTITEPRFCIGSGQDVFLSETSRAHDQYGKCRKAFKLYTSTWSKIFVVLDSGVHPPYMGWSTRLCRICIQRHYIMVH